MGKVFGKSTATPKKQADLNATSAEFDERVSAIAKELMERDNCIIGFRYAVKPAEVETIRGGHSGNTRPVTAAEMATIAAALAE